MGCPHNFKGDAINTQTNPKNSLKIDYFLYSCFEFEQTCKAFPGRGTSEQRWPEAVKIIEAGQAHQTTEGDEAHEEYFPAGSFTELLEQSFAWYEKEFPELKGEGKIELENVGAISTAAVFFALDLKLLTRRNPEALDALAQDTNPLWRDIQKIVEAHGGRFLHYIYSYLRWSFVKTEEKVWEVGDRPPVGRYTPGAARRNSSRPYSGGFSSGPRRGGPSGRPSDRDRGPRRDGDKGPRGGRDRDRDRDRGDKGRSRPPRGENRGNNSHADQEQAAIETVKVAIDKLRADTSLSEVRLDPSNSFFRRLQHKKAVADGFYSYSTGEGNGRSVVVTRDKPANEDAE